jgi:hypothetical protein
VSGAPRGTPRRVSEGGGVTPERGKSFSTGDSYHEGRQSFFEHQCEGNMTGNSLPGQAIALTFIFIFITKNFFIILIQKRHNSPISTKIIFITENGGLQGFLILKTVFHRDPFFDPFFEFSHTFYWNPFF